MWFSFRNSIYNHGNTEYPFLVETKLHDIQKTHIGGIIWGTPIVDEKNSLYVGTSSGIFYKINSTGDIDWRYSLVSKTDSLIDSAAVIHPLGYVIIPGGDGYLHAVDRHTGKLLWRTKAPHNIDDKIDRSGAIVNSFEGNVQVDIHTGLIYAGNDNSYFYCLDATGKEMWSVKTNMMIWSCAAITDKYVIFGCLDHHIYLVDKKTGTVYYKLNLGAEIKSSPVYLDNYVLIGNSNGDLTCLKIDKNNQLTICWKLDLGTEIYSTCSIKDNHIVACTFMGTIYCIRFHHENPDVIWKFNTYNNICSSPLITGDDQCIVTDSKGMIYAFNLKDGRVTGCCKLNQHSYKTQLNSSPVLDSKGIIHVGGYDGRVYHISYNAIQKNACSHIPKFMLSNKNHLDLEYDGKFIKIYKVRVFYNNKYAPNAVANINTVNSTNGIAEASSDGGYINIFHKFCSDINTTVSLSTYTQTNSWFKDRFQYWPLGSIKQNIQHQFSPIKEWNFGSLSCYDIANLCIIQPKILDTYIPAALDAVAFKMFLLPLDPFTNTITAVMMPAIKQKETDELVIIPEPKKVLLLSGRVNGNILYLRSKKDFAISSMGGTIKFKNFDCFLQVENNVITGEFLASTSCLSIKGNDNNYSFSSELINQLCNPKLVLNGIGVINGIKKGLRYVDNTGYYKVLVSSSDKTLLLHLNIDLSQEHLIVIIYKTKNNEYEFFSGVAKGEIFDSNIKLANIQNFSVFIDGTLCQ